MQSPITTIGCDLGDKASSLVVLKPDGTKERQRLKTSPAAFRQWFGKRAASHVIIESGSQSHWVCSLLEELGHSVTVANSRRVELISKNTAKSDENDPELLARLGRADRELLSPIKHRSLEAQADLAVARARNVLVECRTKLINSCRGMAKIFGTKVPKCTTETFHKQAPLHIPPELNPALQPVLGVLECLDWAIDAHDAEIKKLAEKYPDVAVISQPSGVGLLTALVFLLTLEDKTRFEKSRDVGPYLGLTRRRKNSGDSDPDLGITKAGDSMLRRLLVQSGHYILGPFGPDTDLRRWGLKLVARGGKNAKKRATVAVARKLAVLLHRLWVTGEDYEPLRNSGPAVPH